MDRSIDPATIVFEVVIGAAQDAYRASKGGPVFIHSKAVNGIDAAVDRHLRLALPMRHLDLLFGTDPESILKHLGEANPASRLEPDDPSVPDGPLRLSVWTRPAATDPTFEYVLDPAAGYMVTRFRDRNKNGDTSDVEIRYTADADGRSRPTLITRQFKTVKGEVLLRIRAEISDWTFKPDTVKADFRPAMMGIDNGTEIGLSDGHGGYRLNRYVDDELVPERVWLKLKDRLTPRAAPQTTRPATQETEADGR